MGAQLSRLDLGNVKLVELQFDLFRECGDVRDEKKVARRHHSSESRILNHVTQSVLQKLVSMGFEEEVGNGRQSRGVRVGSLASEG
jgi:hypothetical protein